MIYCTNTQAYRCCATAYQTQNDRKDVFQKYILYKRAHEISNHYYKLKKKELKRIKKAKEKTPLRYKI